MCRSVSQPGFNLIASGSDQLAHSPRGGALRIGFQSDDEPGINRLRKPCQSFFNRGPLTRTAEQQAAVERAVAQPQMDATTRRVKQYAVAVLFILLLLQTFEETSHPSWQF